MTLNRTLINLALLPKLWLTSRSARRYALAHHLPGLAFNDFGRKAGRKLLLHYPRSGIVSLLHPVTNVRYFEFEFALSSLPVNCSRCLDVSSPRLFSLYVATQRPWTHVHAINPDAKDLSETTQMAKALNLSNLIFDPCAIDSLAGDGRFDCIWSLSVVEHISGAYDDSAAVAMMYNLLVPGGRLIVTIPVDRRYWLEYRGSDYYGTQPTAEDGRVFFQRNYDANAINERLINPVKRRPSVTRWFGEIHAGTFTKHEERSMRYGLRGCILDPKEMVDNWREYESWKDMPGWGVCGIVIDKPASPSNP